MAFQIADFAIFGARATQLVLSFEVLYIVLYVLVVIALVPPPAMPAVGSVRIPE